MWKMEKCNDSLTDTHNQWKREWKCLHLFTQLWTLMCSLNQSATNPFRMTGDTCLLWQLQQAAAEIKLKHLLSVEAEVKTKWEYRSCCVVWLWEAHFKDEHFGNCGLKVQSLLLHGRVFSFHVHCLFVRQRHSALWDTLNCDILVAEVPPELVTDLSCSFYCSHPTSCKLVNEHFFSTIEPLYSCISRHMYRLTNQKVSIYVLKNHKLVYP